MQKIKHSKFKNTGILFELLVRQVTSDILNGKEKSKANYLLQKYFKENTELGKELKLYKLVLEEKTKNESSASSYLDLILKTRKKLSNYSLSEQKYNLIKEIKDSFPINDFLKGTISNYKLLASVYKVFEECSSAKEFEPTDIFKSKECIIESLHTKKQKKVELEDLNEDRDLLDVYKKEDSDSKLLIYKLVVESFNDKYKGLSDRQKLLLKEYIYNISNTNRLREFVNKEVDDCRQVINEKCSSLTDEVLKIKLHEVYNQSLKIKDGSIVKDTQIVSLLNIYELISELSKTS